MRTTRVGNCLTEIKKYCDTVKIGSGALADCISDVIAESEMADPSATGEGWAASLGPSPRT